MVTHSGTHSERWSAPPQNHELSPSTSCVQSLQRGEPRSPQEASSEEPVRACHFRAPPPPGTPGLSCSPLSFSCPSCLVTSKVPAAGLGAGG